MINIQITSSANGSGFFGFRGHKARGWIERDSVCWFP